MVLKKKHHVRITQCLDINFKEELFLAQIWSSAPGTRTLKWNTDIKMEHRH